MQAFREIRTGNLEVEGNAVTQYIEAAEAQLETVRSEITMRMNMNPEEVVNGTPITFEQLRSGVYATGGNNTNIVLPSASAIINGLQNLYGITILEGQAVSFPIGRQVSSAVTYGVAEGGGITWLFGQQSMESNGPFTLNLIKAEGNAFKMWAT